MHGSHPYATKDKLKARNAQQVGDQSGLSNIVPHLILSLLQAHLISIRDQAENDFVFERFNSSVQQFWLGGHATCSGEI